MHHWTVPGERIVAIMTAGNLATTQSVISQLVERDKAPAERHNTVLEAPTMFQVATVVGKLLRETIQRRDADNGQEGAGQFTASIIIAGQIKGMEPRIFLIYPEGNFIEASFDTPSMVRTTTTGRSRPAGARRSSRRSIRCPSTRSSALACGGGLAPACPRVWLAA
jgi:predicted proteasome-type protease